MSDEVEVLLKQYLEEISVLKIGQEIGLKEKKPNEDKAKIDSRDISIGIRNSGTQKKSLFQLEWILTYEDISIP